MVKYIVKRLLQLIPVILAITFLSFALLRLAGGDAVTYFYERRGTAVSQEVIDKGKALYGLDQPFLVQYGNWLKKMVSGDMGISYVSQKPVFSTFLEKLPATILLTASSIMLTLLIALPLGIYSALKQNSKWDYLIRTFTFLGNSLPNFFVAMVLLYFLAIKLALLPVISGGVTLKGLILPTLTLTISMGAKYTRQVRAIVLEEVQKDYVVGAKARGVRFPVIMIRSVLRSSLFALITLLALSIGSLLGGTAIVESIFMWDGVGKLVVDAIIMRDYPIIQAYVVWMSIIYAFVNLLTDIVYHLLDPRVGLEEVGNI
ncbi:MAG: ABC transporter permease [Acidaminococcaceae bacterium]|jgi:peptide/nickel transport system permease protein|nr:ABC transporter permease [Acidaminococcaceae bacterium]MCI2109847.1 ABC transporter permease [Acidaminococcaceae bacterium]